MSDAPDAAVRPPDNLATRFARRVTERDLMPPAPPSMTPEAIGERVGEWLRRTHDVRHRRYRATLVQMLLVLLAQPDAPTATLTAAAGLQARMAARTLARLGAWGLTEHFARSRTRYHRLTRAAEDALLPVVQGVAAGG